MRFFEDRPPVTADGVRLPWTQKRVTSEGGYGRGYGVRRRGRDIWHGVRLEHDETDFDRLCGPVTTRKVNDA